MTPEYLLELADKADPEELWKLPLLDQLDLPSEQKQQLDSGVALRRYAAHIEQLTNLLGTGRSLCITPLSKNGVMIRVIETP